MSDHEINLTKKQNIMPVNGGILQRKSCSCGRSNTTGGECAECRKKRLSLQRQAVNQNEPVVAPPIVHEVLRSPGRPLDPTTRSFMEPRFNHDFGRVRVHTDGKAAASATEVNAHAYTVGRHVVFGAGQYAPRNSEGRKLIAHELAHVVQQSPSSGSGHLDIAPSNSVSERDADRAANNIMEHGQRSTNSLRQSPVQISRQLEGGSSGGGGAGGSFGSPTTPSTAIQVCARPLQISPHGNHAYIEAPPDRYAIISPTCPGKWSDNPITGTGGQKWDNSPDPCGKTPTCIPCNPAPGVTNVASCLRTAFNAYANPSFYRILGPNSNTFAGTLARTCCAGMIPKPAALGWVPGWDDPPAGPYGGDDCPPGPTC